MPLELLERDEVLASIMPGHGVPGQPGNPGGDEAPPEEETDVPEGEPGGDGGG